MPLYYQSEAEGVDIVSTIDNGKMIAKVDLQNVTNAYSNFIVINVFAVNKFRTFGL